MTRDELEAVLWQQLATRSRLLTGGRNGGTASIAVAADEALVNAVLEAADAFAATTAAGQ